MSGAVNFTSCVDEKGGRVAATDCPSAHINRLARSLELAGCRIEMDPPPWYQPWSRSIVQSSHFVTVVGEVTVNQPKSHLRVGRILSSMSIWIIHTLSFLFFFFAHFLSFYFCFFVLLSFSLIQVQFSINACTWNAIHLIARIFFFLSARVLPYFLRELSGCHTLTQTTVMTVKAWQQKARFCRCRHPALSFRLPDNFEPTLSASFNSKRTTPVDEMYASFVYKKKAEFTQRIPGGLIGLPIQNCPKEICR